MKRKSFYSFITIVLLVNCLISCASLNQSNNDTSAPKDAADVSSAIKKADELFRDRSDLSKLREAVNLLSQARNPDNRNYEVEWKFAKYNYFLGDSSANDEKESEKAFENGIQAGKIASRLEPNKPDGYFWYGANLGEQADRAPLTKGLMSVGEIRDAMNKTIEIQPDYENASAFDVLAQIELATRMTGGDAQKAIDYLEKAIKLSDANSNLHLHLAEAYLAVNRKADAKKQLEYTLQMKPNPDYLPEFQDSQKEARQMLETKF